MNRELTKEQRRTLDTIIRLTKRFGYSPTIREICAEDGLSSTSTVDRHLVALKKKKYITYEPSKFRTIRVLRYPDE